MEEEIPERSTSVATVKSAVNSRAKADVYKDGPWEEWMNHFKLCTVINEWDEKPECCQQLAVSLRGRAQAVYVTLSEEEKTNYKKLLDALDKIMTPTRKGRLQISVSSKKTVEGRQPGRFGH